MKKTTILFISGLFLVACNQQEQDLTTSVLHSDSEDNSSISVQTDQPENTEIAENNEIIEDTESTEQVSPKKVLGQKTTVSKSLVADACSANKNKDECYFQEIKNKMIYNKDNVKNSKEDIKVCDKISKDSWMYADCYRMFAVKNLDLTMCENLPSIPTSNPTAGYSLEKNDCKKAIQYSYQDAQWKATGASPTITTWPYEYSGVATLHGWSMDVNDNTYFQIIQEDAIKLPPPFKDSYFNKGETFFSISHNSKDILDELKSSDKQNPATITVNRISSPWEGTPKLDILRIK